MKLKKFAIVFAIAICSCIYGYSEEIFLNKDVDYEGKVFKKNSKIIFKKKNYDNIYPAGNGIFNIYGYINNEKIQTTSENICFNEGINLPDFLFNCYWIKDYYYDFIYTLDEKKIFEKEPFWTEDWIKYLNESDTEWNELFFPAYVKFGKKCFYTDSNQVEQEDLFALCFLASQNNNEYHLRIPYSQIGYFKEASIACDKDFLRIYNECKNADLILVRDGDYLSVYTGAIDAKNFVFRLARADNETYNQIIKYVRQDYNDKEYDLKKITYPNHADGFCDYDLSKAVLSKSKPAEKTHVNEQTQEKQTFQPVQEPQKQKKEVILTTACNLKLRESESLSSKVIVVMAKSTPVKIVEFGKNDKIDGIDSKWVKVEVQRKSKDPKGNPVAEGITGWCFAWYLE